MIILYGKDNCFIKTLYDFLIKFVNDCKKVFWLEGVYLIPNHAFLFLISNNPYVFKPIHCESLDNKIPVNHINKILFNIQCIYHYIYTQVRYKVLFHRFGKRKASMIKNNCYVFKTFNKIICYLEIDSVKGVQVL